MKYEIRDLRDVKRRSIRRNIVGLVLMTFIFTATAFIDFPEENGKVTEAMVDTPATVTEYQQPTDNEILIQYKQLVSPYLLNSEVITNKEIYVPRMNLEPDYDMKLTEFSGTVTDITTPSPTPMIEPSLTPVMEVDSGTIESFSIPEEDDSVNEDNLYEETISGFDDDEAEHLPESMQVISGFNKWTEITCYSNLTVAEVNKLIEKYPGFNGIADEVVYVERTYGINALFVLAVASLESSYGDSRLAEKKNNLFGLGAFDESPGSSSLTFDTPGDSVLYFGELISDHYVGNGRTCPKSIADKYCSSTTWSSTVAKIMNQYGRKIDD